MPGVASRPDRGHDNLAVHKNEVGRERIKACGRRLVFLPAYSPDFNPIEHAFAKLKNCLRKATACVKRARAQETLEAAIAAALATIPPPTTPTAGSSTVGSHLTLQPF